MTAMSQDLADLYDELSPAERRAVDEGILLPAGGEEAVRLLSGRRLMGGCPRLTRRGFSLWAEAA
jgi:hypothetical protein